MHPVERPVYERFAGQVEGQICDSRVGSTYRIADVVFSTIPWDGRAEARALVKTSRAHSRTIVGGVDCTPEEDLSFDADVWK